jgi:hypothetical protein
MKKKFLLFFAIACSLVAFGQDHKKEGWDVSVGPTLFAPMAKSIDWNSKSWGQAVKFNKKNVVVSLGFMQDNNNFVVAPVLVGVRKHLKHNLYVGLDGGVTFFHGHKGQFTYVPTVGYKINQKWCLEQSILRTVKEGKTTNRVGLGLLYNL